MSDWIKNKGSGPEGFDFTKINDWIEDDKGSGSEGFDFTKQISNYSYNEGDVIATVENPIWPITQKTGFEVPVSPTHNPCKYWFDSPKSETYVPVGYCKFPKFTEVGVLTLNSGENSPRSINIYEGYLYADLYTNPKKVVKIRLSNFQRVGVLTLSIDAYDACNAVIVNGFYYTGGISGGIRKVCKVDLSSFTEVGTVNIPISANFGDLHAAVTDSDYIYYGGSCGGSSPAWFYPLNLNTFTFGPPTITPQTHGTYWQSGSINVNKNVIVWGVDTGVNDSIVRKFTISPFAQTDYKLLQTLGQTIQSSAIDAAGIWGYFAGIGSAIRKVALVDTEYEGLPVFAMTQVAVLYPVASWFMGMVLDEANNKLYLIDANSPARLLRINLDYFYLELLFNLTNPGTTKPSLALDTDNQILYVSHYLSPAKITKISICGDY